MIKLAASVSSKGDTYAFRWDDPSKTGHILTPFLQIVIRKDGEFVNYYNTLDLFPK